MSHGSESGFTTELQSASPVDSINKELGTLSSLSSDCCIYKVPERLRRLNPDAYSPRVVSIGPLHHGIGKYPAMEDHKLRYLQSFVCKTDSSLEDLVGIASKWEERARLCYAEDVELDSNAFVKMLVVDAGFLVVLFLRSQFDEDKGELDRIYGKQKMIVDVNHDIMLLENQLPYFVVKEMYGLLRPDNNRGRLPLPQIIHGHFKKFWMSIPSFSSSISDSEIHHFVGLLRSIHLPLVLRKVDEITLNAKAVQNEDEIDSSALPGESLKMMDSILSAKVIQNAGVKLKPANSSTAPLDIKFANGVLTIPIIKISDITEALYRNIILFEQCHLLKAYFSDYMMFLSCFVRAPMDAELFIDHGIIVNRRGNAKHISSLFDRVLKETTQTSYSTYYYQSVYDNLQAHCNTSWNKWHATLRRDYFHNPWSAISVGAALLLLLLTFIQALCSILAL